MSAPGDPAVTPTATPTVTDGPGHALPPLTSLTGGATGLAASWPQLVALASAYDASGDRLRDWAGEGSRVLLDADLLASAPLAPRTFAAAEAAVVAACAGPEGALAASAAWETDAVLVRVTLHWLRESDELVRATFEAVDLLAGRAVGFTLTASAPLWLPGAVVVGGAAALLWPTLLRPALPPSVRRDLDRGLTGVGRLTEQWLLEHPGLVQHLANGGGGLLDGLWDGLTPATPGGPFGLPSSTPDTESAAGLLAGLYDDRTGVAVPRGDLAVGLGAVAPATLAGLLTHLQQVAALSGPDGRGAPGAVEVQTLRGPDGQVRHVVYLPGTDDLGTLPWTQDSDVRDMATNYLLLAGESNAYQDGVVAALEQAGVQPDEPVLLVGHSQGGMTAAALLAQGSPYDVTHVVTAGSPTAHLDGFPAGTHVVSLENHGDVVPLLDGEDNPDTAEQLTVGFDAGGAGVVGHHGLPAYVAGAAALDASAHPGVVEQVESLTAAGFLDPGGHSTASSQVLQVVAER